MIKPIFLTIFLFLSFFLTSSAFAQGSSFVSIVNPVRGEDFWEEKDQRPQTVVFGQLEILRQQNIPATWLIRFDALKNTNITDALKGVQSDEKGLFLEITPTWSAEAGVAYRKSENWHAAGSAFLSGYEQDERIKLVDSSFEEFKRVFGYYPKSVGAWWIDSYSVGYMQKKYGITTALIVSDQYTTDNYQIWGQYWSTPYYPSKINALHPAQTLESKLPVVITQWAARDPVNGYGNGVLESTFSVQANDYIDYHDLDTKYFSKLIDIYTQQPFNKFAHLVVGLENSYSWSKYSNEYKNQIDLLMQKQKEGQLSIVTLANFSNWYQKTFPQLSPEHIIIADDPLGSFKKVVWFMNPYYRVGWFFNQDGSVFRDIRQYIDGQEELCLKDRCDSVNFATSATRVLDEVSFGHKKVLDEGKISDFNVRKSGENFVITYKNEAGKERSIEFLPRDIRIDDKISSIDTIILETTKDQLDTKKEQIKLKQGSFEWSFLSVLTKTFLFLGFLTLGCFIPGLLILNKILLKVPHFLQKGMLALVLGFSIITLLFYILSIFQIKQAIFIYLLINFLLLFRMHRQVFTRRSFNIKDRFNILIACLIGLGTIFQSMPTFKSGLIFPFGMGFWGPNTHDGIWHVALINELTKGVPPQNPIFGGEVLKNYHYFYDLLVAVTHYVSGISILDLLFRFYPIIFSLLLGIGSYFIIKLLTKQKLAQFLGVYLVYFAGSFGWIVEYIKFGNLGGESAFWANQSISFNLNPPYAISLLIVIAILLLLPNLKSKLSVFVLTVLAGTLIAFKAYAAVLILLTLLLVGILKRNLKYLLVFLTGSFLSAVLFIANFSIDKQLIVFSPFWFIHSMVDSPDRVGWARLSLARVAGLEQGNWFKFFASETISLIIFVLGNLGTRVFALFGLIKIQTIFKDTYYLFLFVFSFLAFSIPIFFIQAGNPWNTIQFLYYFLYISALLGGIVFAKFICQFPKTIAIVFTVIFMLITPINSWATANGYLSYSPHAFISNTEIEALKFLESQEEGKVLTFPYDPKLKNKIAEPWPIVAYDSTAYVTAFTRKEAFLEDEPQNQILLTDYKKRLIASKDFFANPNLEAKKFLTDNEIKYIYLPKIFDVSLNPDQLDIKLIYENKEVYMYEVQ